MVAITSAIQGKDVGDEVAEFWDKIVFERPPKHINKSGDERDKLADRLSDGTPEDKKIKKKEAKEIVNHLKELPISQRKEEITKISKELHQEQDLFKQKAQKEIEQLKNESTQFAAELKKARENGDTAAIAKYTALINQNNQKVKDLEKQIKNLPSQEEIQRSLTTIVNRANKS